MRPAMRPHDEVLTSRDNPLFKRLRALKRRAGAQEELLLIEGPRLLGEALDARLRVLEAAVAASRLADPALAPLLARLAAAGVRPCAIKDRLLASLSEVETSQGVLALARRPALEADDAFSGTPLLLVGVGIQNPGNLGGLLRTAEAADATGAWLTEGCADPFSWKSLRGSMGSAFRLPQVRGLATEAILERLRARGVALLATDANGETRFDQADLRGPVALVVGAEGAGLGAAVLDRAARRLRIPLAPPVESLNVTVAGALVLYEAARQRGFPARGVAR